MENFPDIRFSICQTLLRSVCFALDKSSENNRTFQRCECTVKYVPFGGTYFTSVLQCTYSPDIFYILYLDYMSVLTGIDAIRVINLAHRNDRMEKFDRNHPFLVEKYSRVDAVYGKTLELTEEIFKLFKHNNFGWKKNVIGCALSHYYEWQKIANGEFGERVLIMEDDALLDKDFLEKWTTAFCNLPNDAHLIFLGGVLPVNEQSLIKVTEPINSSFARIAVNTVYGKSGRIFHFCAYSYIINRKGAQILLHKIQQCGITKPIDGFLMYTEAIFVKYFSNPLLCTCTQMCDPKYVHTNHFEIPGLALYDSDIQNTLESFTTENVRPFGKKTLGFDSICVITLSRNLDTFVTNHSYLDYISVGIVDYTTEMSDEVKYLFRDNDFQWDTTEISRTMAHYGIWKKVASGVIGENVFILEDDVIINRNFVENWANIVFDIPKNCGLIYLGGVEPEKRALFEQYIEKDTKYFAKCKWQSITESELNISSYAYVLTKHAAEVLCSVVEKMGFLVKLDTLLLYMYKPLNTHVSKQHICSRITDKRVYRLVIFDEKQRSWCIEQMWLQEIFSCEFIFHSYQTEYTFLEGDTVFLLYQYFVDPMLVEKWLDKNKELKVFLIHLSDENCKSNVKIYNHPVIQKVFRNYWRPEVVSSKVIHIPLGYVKHYKQKSTHKRICERPYVWSFAGAMDRPLRKDVLLSLEQMGLPSKIHKTPTWGTSSNLGENDYLNMLVDTKFVPCLPGFFNVECFRFYEALECGAIPIISLDDKKSYANILAGYGDLPLYGCEGKNWELLHELSKQTESANQKMCDEIQKWWTEYKCSLKKHICYILNN